MSFSPFLAAGGGVAASAGLALPGCALAAGLGGLRCDLKRLDLLVGERGQLDRVVMPQVESPGPWRLIPESLGRDRLMPERFGSAAVTSESLGRSGVDSNSSLASRALSSKSLPDSGWRTSTRSLEGLSSKSLSDSAAGTSAEEPTTGWAATAVSPEPEAGVRKP